jgi:hypothetical protein
MYETTGIKMKLNKDSLKHFLSYLNLILNKEDNLINSINSDYVYNALIRTNLETTAKKVIDLLYKSNFINKTYTLKLTHSERLSIFIVICYYQLPSNLIDIEYNINNKLIANEY